MLDGSIIQIIGSTVIELEIDYLLYWMIIRCSTICVYDGFKFMKW